MSVMQTPEGRIDIRQLSIVLGEGAQAFEAVQGLDCQIEAGQFVCILGPSGCGKSTLLGALAGHLQPRSGSLKVDGARCPARHRSAAWCSSITHCSRGEPCVTTSLSA